MPKIDEPCPVCRAARYPGRLWLGGREYVDCPECEGTGRLTGFIQYFGPTVTFDLGRRRHAGVVLAERKGSTEPVVIAGS
jgi:hypothetical protein